MWFLFALLTTLLWGTADLFYKIGAYENEKYTHLKTAAAVGTVMGLHAIYTLIFGNISYDPINILIYLPVSLMYILSMTVGYFGLKYLELSVSSPIQNSSGAVVSILCFLILKESVGNIALAGIIAVCIGVFALGVLEKTKGKNEISAAEKKYKIGFAAFFMPVIYCVIDALGTFFDAYYLDDVNTTPLVNVTEDTFENVANTSYELTFFIFAIAIILFLAFKKEKIRFSTQKERFAAAIFETAGQFFYVFALSGNGIVAAPMIASYSVVSVILSRIFLREKLTRLQYVFVALVMVGIVFLGIADAT